MARPGSAQRFRLDHVPTPIGTMLIVIDDEGRLRALDWGDYEIRMHRLLRLHYGPEGVDLVTGDPPGAIRASLARYFAGDLTALDAIPIQTGGTAFQRELWAALREIPAGRTMSYGALAAKIGRPSAIRAAGAANGANPVGVVVPCHRVIGADASLTGYGGGLERKRWLLCHEGVDLAAQILRK